MKNRLIHLTKERLKQSVVWLLRNKKEKKKRSRQGKERVFQLGVQVRKFIRKIISKRDKKD